MKKVITFLFLTTTIYSFCQINTFYVSPILTDTNYAAIQDSHLVVTNSATPLNKLFLFIGGSGSKTWQYQALCIWAGYLGFDVISLSYPNDMAAIQLAWSQDSLVFNKYRQEICYGTPVSDCVSVDTLNSINTRTVKLLNYLSTTYPAQNWDQYLTGPTTLDWSKITVGGHSQGSGHACYFAKFNEADRVLMFSGPNDYSNYFSRSANWLRTPGVAPVYRHFAYLSLLDEMMDFGKQLIDLHGLGLYPAYDTAYVDISSPPYDDSHCLYTTQDTNQYAYLYHNTTTQNSTLNHTVWTYMLTSAITTGVYPDKENIGIEVYPNPFHNEVTFDLNNLAGHNVFIEIFDMCGQLVYITNDSCRQSIKLNLNVPAGIYFYIIKDQNNIISVGKLIAD